LFVAIGTRIMRRAPPPPSPWLAHPNTVMSKKRPAHNNTVTQVSPWTK
jgi:hypothetical protein